MQRYLAAGCLLTTFLVIYLPDLGHGFIKDDFVWIAASRSTSLTDAFHLLGSNVGFFRPLVSASFAVDHQISGLDPFGYAFTNLAIFLVDVLLLFYLARTLRLPSSVALFAVSLWALNFHGVNVSLLWISGRTALLLCAFALAAGIAALSGHRLLAGVFSLLAMLCKEEAVLLPGLLVAFDWLDSPRSSQPWWNSLGHSIRRAWPVCAALALYLGLRLNSGAFWLQDAPSYYQFSFSPPLLMRNMLEYLDREARVSCAALLALWLFARHIRVTLNADEKRTATFGLVWFLVSNVLTVFLPIRSDLYALTPSVGVVLVAAAAASAFRPVVPDRFASCCLALMVITVLAIPIYWQRNERWVDAAELSARVVRTLSLATTGTTSGQLIVIDDPSARPNLDGSFGGLFSDAVRLTIGPHGRARSRSLHV